MSPADGGEPTGTCPTVVPDDQPCAQPGTVGECDTFAECFSGTGKAGTPGLVGTCTLLDKIACHEE